MMTPGSIVFIDTNILLVASDTSRQNHSVAKGIFNYLLESGRHPAMNGQVIREYLTVATRPLSVNGFGMNPSEASHNITQFNKKIQLFDETVVTAELLQHLVIRHKLKGKRIHDANLVATMRTHGIKYLLTENKKDFSCFEDIEIYNLEEAVSISNII